MLSAFILSVFVFLLLICHLQLSIPILSSHLYHSSLSVASFVLHARILEHGTCNAFIISLLTFSLHFVTDQEYVETALLAQRLNFNPIIVLDRLDEIHIVLAAAKKLGIQPRVGVRAKVGCFSETLFAHFLVLYSLPSTVIWILNLRENVLHLLGFRL